MTARLALLALLATLAPASAVARNPKASDFPVGTAVLAAWHSGHYWFAGIAVGTEGRLVRVQYLDGTSEALAPRFVVEDRLGPTMYGVSAHQVGETAFMEATIRDRIGPAVAVDYLDGRKLWTSVGFVRVDSATPPVGVVRPEPAPVPSGHVGSRVLARGADGFYYPAVVIGHADDGLPIVIHADGSGQAATDLLPDTIREGSLVHARDQVNDVTITATVVARVEDAVQVRVADGSTRWFALADIRLDAPAD